MKKIIVFLFFLMVIATGKDYYEAQANFKGNVDVADTLTANGVLMTNETSVKSTIPQDKTWFYPYDDGSSVRLAATKDDAGTESIAYLAEMSDVVNLSTKPAGAFYHGNGTDQYLYTPDNANLQMGTNDFAYMLRVKLPDYTPSAAVTLARKANTTDNLGWIWTLETDCKLQLAIGNGTNFTTLVYKITAALSVINDSWTTLTFVYTRETASTAGSVKFYQDGTLNNNITVAAGTPQTVTESTPSSLISFQNIDGATEYAFSCNLQLLFNYAPTQAEIRQNFTVWACTI